MIHSCNQNPEKEIRKENFTHQYHHCCVQTQLSLLAMGCSPCQWILLLAGFWHWHQWFLPLACFWHSHQWFLPVACHRWIHPLKRHFHESVAGSVKQKTNG